MAEVLGLSWGAVTAYAAKYGNDGSLGAWKKLPNIVEDSTTINPTKGDKREAKIEGGQNEFVSYKKSTYTVEWEHRFAVEDTGLREKPFDDVDGLVSGVYCLMFIPEDATAPGFKVKRCTLTVDDSFSSSEGIKWKYTAEVLAPADKTKSIVYDVFTDPTASDSDSESESEAEGAQS